MLSKTKNDLQKKYFRNICPFGNAAVFGVWTFRFVIHKGVRVYWID
jgi:hypothetical protein